ncbi:MAG: orotidine-5'-phosphate decarboxylase [Armatimonadota bacterium]|nr:orotidine-5'-phosphate decarboxylase [Armatimonadota bacterium]
MTGIMATPPPLVVALDVPSLDGAARLLDRLRPAVQWFKVGAVLFTAAGPEAVRMVHAAGGVVFLDLKFHDIPQTMEGAVAAAADLGVALLTVHCAAGPRALEAAARAARRSARLRVLGVTRLTSAPGRGGVVRAARTALAAGLHGVTAAAGEVRAVKRACGAQFLVLTPGIRPAGVDAGDQVRVATPQAAVRAGSDFLVVGRPIAAASDPLAAARAIQHEITAAWERRARRTGVDGATREDGAPPSYVAAGIEGASSG